MKKKNIDIEQELTLALQRLKNARVYRDQMYRASYTAENDYIAAKHAYDDLFFNYVRYGEDTYWDEREAAKFKFEKALEHANSVGLNYKIACCQFKKAERVYERLKKKAKKMGVEWGEE